MDRELVRTLHRRTRLPHRACHAALVEGLGDVELALVWLREQGHLANRNWLWEQGDLGPDAFCELRVTQAVDLRDVVAAIAPLGMTRVDDPGPMTSGFRAPVATARDLWLDRASALTLTANRRGEAGASLWGYASISVSRERLWLENGFGYAPPECVAAQVDVLAAVARRCGAAVASWSVEYGGQGYTIQRVAGGRTARSLADYVGFPLVG